MTFRTILLSQAALFIVGIALHAIGLALPPFVDPSAAEALILAPVVTESACQLPDLWHERLDLLRTSRSLLLDGSRGLMLFSATLAVGVGVARRAGIRSMADLRTPASTGGFLVPGSAAVLWLIWALSFSLVIDLRRAHFPWCSDSIFIPMVGLWHAGALLLVVLMLAGFIVSRFFGALPASLWINDEARPIRSWIWTLLSGALVAALVPATVYSAFSSAFFAVPSCLVGIYLAVAMRAAALAPPRSRGT